MVADSLNPHTIHLDDGIYSDSTNGEFFPILLSDYCNLIGESDSSVILNGEGKVVLGLIGNNHSIISGMTIKGAGDLRISFLFQGRDLL